MLRVLQLEIVLSAPKVKDTKTKDASTLRRINIGDLQKFRQQELRDIQPF
jgi:hypothetical protein